MHVSCIPRAAHLPWGDSKTNVILAMGAIPTTTILLNSIEKIRPHAGQRLTSHFRSNIKARFRPNRTRLGQVPLSGQDGEDADLTLSNEPVMSACHVCRRGENNLQWHVQVRGTYEPVGYQGIGLKCSSKPFTSLALDNGDTLTPEQMKAMLSCVRCIIFIFDSFSVTA